MFLFGFTECDDIIQVSHWMKYHEYNDIPHVVSTFISSENYKDYESLHHHPTACLGLTAELKIYYYPSQQKKKQTTTRHIHIWEEGTRLVNYDLQIIFLSLAFS